jgi:hypothetical protein
MASSSIEGVLILVLSGNSIREELKQKLRYRVSFFMRSSILEVLPPLLIWTKRTSKAEKAAACTRLYHDETTELLLEDLQ